MCAALEAGELSSLERFLTEAPTYSTPISFHSVKRIELSPTIDIFRAGYGINRLRSNKSFQQIIQQICHAKGTASCNTHKLTAGRPGHRRTGSASSGMGRTQGIRSGSTTSSTY